MSKPNHKVGDLIYCYHYPINLIQRLTKWKAYKIQEIVVDKFLYILDDKGNRDLYVFSSEQNKNLKYLYKYFITQQEYRKLKLEKINETNL